jgi:hypothetical protein
VAEVEGSAEAGEAQPAVSAKAVAIHLAEDIRFLLRVIKLPAKKPVTSHFSSKYTTCETYLIKI